MTVQELIDELSKIEDKDKKVVYVEDYEQGEECPGLDFPKIHDDCFIEFEGEEINFVLLSAKDFKPVVG